MRSKILLLAVAVLFSHQGTFAQDKGSQQTAVDAAVWGIPIVSMDAMRQAYFRDAKAKYNDIVFWSKPADWKNQTTTPNSSSFYIYMNFNTKSSPVVIEMPATDKVGIFGVVLDAWQKPMTEVGLEGADKGKGGKYLILPPGYKETIPQGYQAFNSETYNGYILFRFTPISNKDVDMDRARNLVKQLKAYNLTAANKPPPQKYIDMAGKEFNGLVNFDKSFYAVLAKMINEEPLLNHDTNWMTQFKAIGIEKGKTFNPSAQQNQNFDKAIKQAHDSFKDLIVNGIEPFAKGSRWGMNKEAMVGKETLFSFVTPKGLDIKSRGFTYYLAYAPPQHLGAASFYMGGTKDAQGQAFAGEQNYKLKVPAKVPAQLYWAVNVYDVDTAAFIRNSPVVGLDSYSKTLAKNPDGTVDIFFGPKAPIGKESNWIFTQPGKLWFAFFRLYGPGKEVLNKTWILPDIEKVPSMKQAGN